MLGSPPAFAPRVRATAAAAAAAVVRGVLHILVSCTRAGGPRLNHLTWASAGCRGLAQGRASRRRRAPRQRHGRHTVHVALLIGSTTPCTACPTMYKCLHRRARQCRTLPRAPRGPAVRGQLAAARRAHSAPRVAARGMRGSRGGRPPPAGRSPCGGLAAWGGGCIWFLENPICCWGFQAIL